MEARGMTVSGRRHAEIKRLRHGKKIRGRSYAGKMLASQSQWFEIW
jgi:hypothetical protein